MIRKIIYVPLEAYKERYTCQLSKAGTGWLERRWIEEGIDYVRVEGKSLRNTIKDGFVLDANGRGYWCCSQVMELLRMIDEGKISSDDVIYFDDFWHPGISALPYSSHLTGIKPKMFAMLHAQSVDRFDFTYPMRNWMRSFELGIGKTLSGIFVTSTCLRDLCLYAGIGIEDTVHICGLPYNSDEVREHFPAVLPKRKKQVIFSSRWDKEKRPDLFLKIVDYVSSKRNDIEFIITTSAENLRSNDLSLLSLLKAYKGLVEVRENQTKEDYYKNLLESAIQVNTADQDFVSWTLLEAATCGCRPLYPYFLSFPEALQYDNKYMYSKDDVEDAGEKIILYIDEAVLDKENYDWIYKPFDSSWKRMYQVMKEERYEKLYSD